MAAVLCGAGAGAGAAGVKRAGAGPEGCDDDQANAAADEHARPDEPASELISQRITELGDWRGETLGRMRALIRQADPDVVEEWKWRGTPVWSHDGIVCTGESYKAVVKLTFAKGASLKDPAGLFNSSLDGNTRRAIDIREGDNDRRLRLQDADSRGDRPQQRGQVEIVEKAEGLRKPFRRASGIHPGVGMDPRAIPAPPRGRSQYLLTS